jgi:hypothetical protein
MARGLSRAEAERLSVRGFFQDVLDRSSSSRSARRWRMRWKHASRRARLSRVERFRATLGVLIFGGLVAGSYTVLFLGMRLGDGHRRLLRRRRNAVVPGATRD